MILSTEKYCVKQGDQSKNIKIYISMHTPNMFYLTVLFWEKQGNWADKKTIEYNFDCKHFCGTSKKEVMKDSKEFLKTSLHIEDYQLIED